MLILAVGDLHFKVGNQLQTDELEKALLNLIDSRKPNVLVLLGDTLDTFERTHTNPLRRATAFIDRLSRKVGSCYLIIGNHDLPNYNSFLEDSHAFTALKQWNTVTVVDTPIESREGFLFVPYVAPGRFFEAIRKGLNIDLNAENINSGDLDLSKYSMVFAHQEFKGCALGPLKSEEGDPWPLSAPLCVSGHIHDHCVLQPNLIYTGTPMAHGHNDTIDKTVSLFHVGDEIREERVDLNLTRRLKFKLTMDQIAVYKPPANSIVRISVCCSTLEFKTLLKTSHVLKLLDSNVTFGRLEPEVIPVNDSTEEYEKISLKDRITRALEAESASVQDSFNILFRNGRRIQIE